MALNVVSTDRLSTNVKTSNLATDLSAVVGSRKNLIINGSFQVMQRGTQTSVTTGKYGIDRWKFEVGNCGTWTLSQDTDVPAGKGFAKSYKIQCTTADASPAAADFVDTRYKFEGQDLQMLQWGNSAAKSITVTFWIKCKKTGTFNLNLLANGAANKSLGKVITISVADTWEQKSVTFAGDTAQAITSDNANRLSLVFWLDAGSDYKGGTSPTSAWETLTSANRAASTTIALADNTANYVNLCGVQLEVGETATEFEHRSYAEELAGCQRYCVVTTRLPVMFQNAAGYVSCCSRPNPVPMRAAPSIALGGTLTANPFFGSTSHTTTTTPTLQSAIADNFIINFTGWSGTTPTNTFGDVYNTTITLDAEL